MLLGALALTAEAPAAAGALESVLDLLNQEIGSSGAAFYVEDPAEGGLVVRCRRPAAAGAGADEVLIPATIAGKAVGALGITLSHGEFDDDARALAEGVARVLALTVRNDDLMRGLGDRLRELDRQALQLDALTRVARRISETHDEDDAQRVVVSEARALLHADSALLLVRGPSGEMRTAAFDGVRGIEPDEDDLLRVLADDGSLRRGRDALVAVPAGDGSTAFIVVSRTQGAPFTESDMEFLRNLADQAAVALANGRLLSGLQREQAQRLALGASIVLAQETERRRVAEDIHDGPVQELVGVGLMLDALSADLRDGPAEVVADVNRAAAAAREAVRALRRAISDLHPMALEELGFTAAVRTLVERIAWRGARVDLDLSAADQLSDTNRTLAFRIVQEAVANIVRHAEPQVVSIAAATADGAVVLTIRDDGVGFDPDDARPGVAEGHLGLAAAQERAALAGGRLSIESSREGGTTLTLTLPARDEEGGQESAGPSESRSSAAARAAESAKRSSTTI